MKSAMVQKKSQHHFFDIRLTGDFYDERGEPKFADMGLSVLDQQDEAGIRYAPLDDRQAELSPDQVGAAQGVIVLTPKVTVQSVSQAESLLAIGRFGVGYDAVDVPACTDADVVVFITAGAVDRPVAEAAVGWMLALTHHVRMKDQLVREGRWDQRTLYMGCELRDRTLGVIGLGGIARQLIKLLTVFGMNRPLAFDPFVTQEQAEALGVDLVDLPTLLKQADFVSLHCPLTDQTRGLIGAKELALMKPTAYLINTARGGIVDEEALYAALNENRLAGAAMDCFAEEPVVRPNRFANLDNVVLGPHSIAWTHELFRDIGRMVCQGMVDLAFGRRPHGVVNPQVFDRPTFQTKWRRLRLA